MAEDTKKDVDIQTKIRNWWTTAYAFWDVVNQESVEDLNYYLGGKRQWKAEDLEKLETQQRPALTYNYLLSMINVVSGYQRQNRQDIKAFNRKGGSKIAAEVLTEGFKHIADNCNGIYEQSYQFMLGLIMNRSFLVLDKTYDYDIVNGDVTYKNFSPLRVFPDPNFETYGMQDAEYQFLTSWVPMSKIKMLYPDLREELESATFENEDVQKYGEGDKYLSGDGSPITEIEKYRYRIKRCFYKEFELKRFLIGKTSGRIQEVSKVPKKVLDEQLKGKESSIFYLERVLPVMRMREYVGELELKYIEKPYGGITCYPIVPYFAYKVENNYFSLINQVKQPQEEVNKRISQSLHHLNQSVNTGFIIDDNALTPDMKKRMENFGAQPGVNIFKKAGSVLERIQPAPLSMGHVNLAEMNIQSIREISGVIHAMQGLKSQSQESGVLADIKRTQGLVTTEVLFDNLSQTQKILGDTMIQFIQRSNSYSREELLRLVRETTESPELKKMKEDAVDQVLNDLSMGRYNTVVSTSPNAVTTRMKNFSEMIGVLKMGFPIPPRILVKASDWPFKEEIIQHMDEQMQSQAQNPDRPQPEVANER
jgi:hypothetical protein